MSVLLPHKMGDNEALCCHGERRSHLITIDDDIDFDDIPLCREVDPLPRFIPPDWRLAFNEHGSAWLYPPDA